MSYAAPTRGPLEPPTQTEVDPGEVVVVDGRRVAAHVASRSSQSAEVLLEADLGRDRPPPARRTSSESRRCRSGGARCRRRSRPGTECRRGAPPRADRPRRRRCRRRRPRATGSDRRSARSIQALSVVEVPFESISSSSRSARSRRSSPCARRRTRASDRARSRCSTGRSAEVSEQSEAEDVVGGLAIAGEDVGAKAEIEAVRSSASAAGAVAAIASREVGGQRSAHVRFSCRHRHLRGLEAGDVEWLTGESPRVRSFDPRSASPPGRWTGVARARADQSAALVLLDHVPDPSRGAADARTR